MAAESGARSAMASPVGQSITDALSYLGKGAAKILEKASSPRREERAVDGEGSGGGGGGIGTAIKGGIGAIGAGIGSGIGRLKAMSQPPASDSAPAPAAASAPS
eukprot:TRINITY_DN4616_c0_g1_i2.p2 TRINITY_DN4616_c0_g1~~TRINITY_DN4616_c0_g1_i2.p2  ORF type:complete len:104 (+),score=32.30 TRINITY_DN4616_c0_g1_i2:555-866(+)